MNKEIIWILWGLWPEASCYLYKNILILWSQTTNKQWLYDKYLSKYKVDFIKIDKQEQVRINTIIENVMSSKMLLCDKEYILSLCKKHKCDYTLLACTELPLVMQGTTSTNIFDTISILTEMVDTKNI